MLCDDLVIVYIYIYMVAISSIVMAHIIVKINTQKSCVLHSF